MISKDVLSHAPPAYSPCLIRVDRIGVASASAVRATVLGASGLVRGRLRVQIMRLILRLLLLPKLPRYRVRRLLLRRLLRGRARAAGHVVVEFK